MKLVRCCIIVVLLFPVLAVMLLNTGSARQSCDESPLDSALPFGQKRLTTPWPKVNNSRGPIDVSESNAANITLSWDLQKTLPQASQIEYEVLFGSSFTVLDQDEPKRIQNGVVKKNSGQYPLNISASGKGKGVYYIRIVAQNSKGVDLALRSQPVLVRVDQPLYEIVEVAQDPTASLLSLLYNKETSVMFDIDSEGSIDQNGNLTVDTTLQGQVEYRWRTTQPECAVVEMNISDINEPQ